jgi:hypothetical protein
MVKLLREIFKSEEGYEIVFFQYASLRYALQGPTPPLGFPFIPITAEWMDTLLAGLPYYRGFFYSDTMAENAIYHNLPFSSFTAAMNCSRKMPVSACSFFMPLRPSLILASWSVVTKLFLVISETH